jgi:methylaspartate mutase sigma subunit
MKRQPTALLTTIESDSHSWNLVYMELLLKEQSFRVVNLGPCAPVPKTIAAIAEFGPDVVVVSTVNGHGYLQGKTLALSIRESFKEQTPALVIGGKLCTSEIDARLTDELLAAGYDAVFVGSTAIPSFCQWLRALEVEQRRARLASAAVKMHFAP